MTVFKVIKHVLAFVLISAQLEKRSVRLKTQIIDVDLNVIKDE